MIDLTPRKRRILRLMGVDVWQQRRHIDSYTSPVPELEVQVPEKQKPETRSKLRVVSGDRNNALFELNEQVKACRLCALHQVRSETVFGAGNVHADYLFVGDAPSQQDDLQGLPFVCKDGQLLSRMIEAMGQGREQAYITNVIKCHSREDKALLSAESINACTPYLDKQIERIAPKVIVALGQASAQALLKSNKSLKHIRGEVYQYGTKGIPLVATFHPRYLLSKPEDKGKAWNDLLLARSQIRL